MCRIGVFFGKIFGSIRKKYYLCTIFCIFGKYYFAYSMALYGKDNKNKCK